MFLNCEWPAIAQFSVSCLRDATLYQILWLGAAIRRRTTLAAGTEISHDREYQRALWRIFDRRHPIVRYERALCLGIRVGGREMPANADRLDRCGKSAAVIGFHQHAAKCGAAQRRRKPTARYFPHKSIERLFLLHADD